MVRLDSAHQDDIIPRILNRRWMWHAAFWFTYMAVSLPSEIRMITTLPGLMLKSGVVVTEKEMVLVLLFSECIIFLYTYAITFWLYPYFFKVYRYIEFLFWGTLLALIINGVSINLVIMIAPNLNNEDWWSAYLAGLSTFALFLFLITGLKFFKDSLIQKQVDNQRFRAAKQAELDNLKAQLSPHFLFNTMNNFYGLAVAQSQQLPDLMLRLSELMRYSLYGTNRATVPLEDEIRYLKNYIALERIRLEDTLKLNFNDYTEGSENIEIPPLILIVFVENAFKHSRNLQNAPISISIDIRFFDCDWLDFKISNNYFLAIKKAAEPLGKTRKNDNTVVGGIGIQNVKKRLEALYPADLHQLVFDDDGHFFKVNLKLKIR